MRRSRSVRELRSKRLEGEETAMKVIIAGGVAGGASCVARLRRLDEQAEILMVERGPYVSFANCGLPYHVGGVIEHGRTCWSRMSVCSASSSRSIADGLRGDRISAAEKTVQLRDVASGEVISESYDKLVLSPGAPSVRPPFPGSTYRGSSRFGRCRTRGRSATGSIEGRASWRAWSGTRGSRRCGRRDTRS